MTIRELTKPSAVQSALDEFDLLGREKFLSKYGYSEAVSYFVVRGSNRYDSKAIFGAAYRYEYGRPLLPKEFSGGQQSVVNNLASLGFAVEKQQAVLMPEWAPEELGLILLNYLERRGRDYKTSTHDAEALSEELRSWPLHDAALRTLDGFRSVSRVKQMLGCFHSMDEQFPPKSIKKVIATTGYIWSVWHQDPEGLKQFVAAARAAASQLTTSSATPDDVDHEAGEGGLVLRAHLVRERDAGLRKKKLADVQRRHGRIACEVCNFESGATFGPGFADVIDVHHVVPLHTSGEVTTKLSDLALLCPNCHRALHKSSQWLTPRALRELRERRQK